MEGTAVKKLVIIGASGHGKVVADIAMLNGYNEIVFLDDNPNTKNCAGFPVVGTVDKADDIDGDKIVAIGNASTRKRIQGSLSNIATLVHPDAVISRRVSIGKGTVIMAGAVVNSDTIIGAGCIVNTCASIDHDCVVGDFSHVSVGSNVAGSCKVGESVWIGAGSVISNNITINNNCIIGAGAVVVKNCEQPGKYVGCPAQLMK